MLQWIWDIHVGDKDTLHVRLNQRCFMKRQETEESVHVYPVQNKWAARTLSIIIVHLRGTCDVKFAGRSNVVCFFVNSQSQPYKQAVFEFNNESWALLHKTIMVTLQLMVSLQSRW